MKVYRARIFTPVANPFDTERDKSYRFEQDGCLVVEDGRILHSGAYSLLPDALRHAEVVNLGSRFLLTPGFIDTHLHAPQLEMIGSYGGHLLEWLQRYTFPTEMRFADPAHARAVARELFAELLRHGTTTALIFSTIHTEATEAFFEESERAGFRGIIGKTLMDRNAPDGLLQPAPQAFEESLALAKKWHRRGLQRYAVTPRFAPTSTPELLERARELVRSIEEPYVHTHVSENRNEVEWVKELFPERSSYCDVYDHYGLLTSRSVLAHGVHLTPQERELLSSRGSRLSHCPNSNLFLGSGLFPMDEIVRAGIPFGLGSDIGAGTTPSLFNAMADAYKVQQVRGIALSPYHLWYLATLGGAETLSLSSETGSLEPGKSADFIALDLESTPLLRLRTSHAEAIEDLLAGLIFIGDDRTVAGTWVAGTAVSGVARIANAG